MGFFVFCFGFSVLLENHRFQNRYESEKIPTVESRCYLPDYRQTPNITVNVANGLSKVLKVLLPRSHFSIFADMQDPQCPLMWLMPRSALSEEKLNSQRNFWWTFFKLHLFNVFFASLFVSDEMLHKFPSLLCCKTCEEQIQEERKKNCIRLKILFTFQSVKDWKGCWLETVIWIHLLLLF